MTLRVVRPDETIPVTVAPPGAPQDPQLEEVFAQFRESLAGAPVDVVCAALASVSMAVAFWQMGHATAKVEPLAPPA